MIDFTLRSEVRIKHHGSEVAHSSLIGSSIKSDFSTKIGTVNYPDMVLRTTNVASILKSDPGMPGFKKKFEHGLPQINGRN